MFISTQNGDIINTDRIQKIITRRKSNGLWEIVAFFGGGDYCTIWDCISSSDIFYFQRPLEKLIGVIDLLEGLYEEEQT